MDRVSTASGHAAVEAAVGRPPKDTVKQPRVDSKFPAWLVVNAHNTPKLPRDETLTYLHTQLAPYQERAHATLQDSLVAQDWEIDTFVRPTVDSVPLYVNREAWLEFVETKGKQLPPWDEHITDGKHTVRATYLPLIDGINQVNRLATFEVTTHKYRRAKPKATSHQHSTVGI